MHKRYIAYFISDGTGITAEALGRSLLTQFANIHFESITIPFVDSIQKAQETIQQIKQNTNPNTQIIIFDTIVNRDIRAVIAQARGYMVDIFATFIAPLEKILATKSDYSVGKNVSLLTQDNYRNRIAAINFALHNDDGISTANYNNADIILIGASRSGKTPTCLYLAMQFGIKAANYPLVEEDLESNKLPSLLDTHKDKLFGLLIEPQALSLIRNERRKNSRYSSINQCTAEQHSLKLIYQRENIMHLDTTSFSIEEISTRILSMKGLKRVVI